MASSTSMVVSGKAIFTPSQSEKSLRPKSLIKQSRLLYSKKSMRAALSKLLNCSAKMASLSSQNLSRITLLHGIITSAASWTYKARRNLESCNVLEDTGLAIYLIAIVLLLWTGTTSRIILSQHEKALNVFAEWHHTTPHKNHTTPHKYQGNHCYYHNETLVETTTISHIIYHHRRPPPPSVKLLPPPLRHNTMWSVSTSICSHFSVLRLEAVAIAILIHDS